MDAAALLRYQNSVLWTLNDCKNNSSVKVSAGNGSRPSMASVIRHADGSAIYKGEYQMIKASTQVVAAELLRLPIPTQHATTRRTISYFSKYHFQELENALVKLEQLQPLLALCAGHWKASHMLANSLTSAATSSQSSKTQAHSSEAPYESQNPVETGRKRLALGTNQRQAAPKKARTDGTGTSDSNQIVIHDESNSPTSSANAAAPGSPNSPEISLQTGRPTLMKRGLAPTSFATITNSLPANGQDLANSGGSLGRSASSPGLHELASMFEFL